MKKFKNNLYIKGTQPLLKAFAEEIEKLGWEYNSTMNSSCNPKYFSKHIDALLCSKTIGFYGQMFNLNSWEKESKLNLPQDWNKALKLAAEIEEEFVLPEKWCIRQNAGQEVCDWFAKYNRTLTANLHGTFTYLCFDEETQYPSFRDNFLSIFTEITFEQFKKYVLDREKEPIEIAGYTAKIEEGKVSIGCYKNITLKKLKALKKVISNFGDSRGVKITDNAAIDGEGNQITLEEIERLIERLDE